MIAMLLFSGCPLRAEDGARPDLEGPRIEETRLDGKAFFPGDIISRTPSVSAMITDTGGQVATIEVLISGERVYVGYPGKAFDASSGAFAFTVPPERELSPGTYDITIRAWDGSGNFTGKKFNQLVVTSGLPQLTGPACSERTMSFTAGRALRITYHLSFDYPVLVLIYNGSTGELKWSKQAVACGDGGRAGLNTIVWDGRDSSGKIATDGYYEIKILAGNRVVGEANFMVAD